MSTGEFDSNISLSVIKPVKYCYIKILPYLENEVDAL